MFLVNRIWKLIRNFFDFCLNYFNCYSITLWINKSSMSSYSLYIFFLIINIYFYQRWRSSNSYSSDYRAFEILLHLKSLLELDPSADPISVIKEIRSAFTFGVIVYKPTLCQVKKQIFHHQGHTVEAYWVNHHRTNE